MIFQYKKGCEGNKPAVIEVKPEGGITGRANLKMYDVNTKGGATIHITRVSGGDMLHVRSLAKDVIKCLLDNIISGNITEDHIQGFKKSSVDSTLKCTEKYCDMCDKKFTTEQGLKLHKAKMHIRDMQLNCDKCKESFKIRSDFEKHKEVLHKEKGECGSPDPKKIRFNASINKDNIKSYKEIEVQVNLEDFELQNKVVMKQ